MGRTSWTSHTVNVEAGHIVLHVEHVEHDMDERSKTAIHPE